MAANRSTAMQKAEPLAMPGTRPRSTRRPPFVSVCIPVRNGERELGHTLSNLLVHSTYPPDRWEVLIGNHDSTDATSSIIQSFQERFSHLRSMHVGFTGPNRAHVRNRTIRESKGDLLIFIDHDVLVCEDFLWKHVEAHDRFPASLVAGAIHTLPDRNVGRLSDELDLNHVSATYPRPPVAREVPDRRIAPGWFPHGDDAVDLRGVPAAFCLFWGGNLSAYRSDIDACGHFDEGYDGWGLEDDDFAQQFRVAGRGMVFSRAAWGFHARGASLDLDQLTAWRKNFETFFRKFTTLEVEAYALYGFDLLPSGMRRLELQLNLMRSIDPSGVIGKVRQRLGPPHRRRLCHFVRDPTIADALELTDALNPFGSPTETARHDGRTHWWPLFGFKTPFADQEIDEVVLLADALVWLDRYQLTLVLCETARIARRAVVVCSAETEGPGGPYALRELREILSTLRFDDLVWMDSA
jgi:glycosyltransferase involved in cell wall biosynthesis